MAARCATTASRSSSRSATEGNPKVANHQKLKLSQQPPASDQRTGKTVFPEIKGLSLYAPLRPLYAPWRVVYLALIGFELGAALFARHLCSFE